MTAAQPDRWVRLLHRFERHGAAVELIDAAPVGDRRLGPQCLDELDAFAKSPNSVLARHLKPRVVAIPTQSYAEDRAAVAHAVERGHLMRHVDGVMNGQD